MGIKYTGIHWNALVKPGMITMTLLIASLSHFCGYSYKVQPIGPQLDSKCDFIVFMLTVTNSERITIHAGGTTEVNRHHQFVSSDVSRACLTLRN